MGPVAATVFEGAPEALLEIDPALADALHRVEPGDELILLTRAPSADRSASRIQAASRPTSLFSGTNAVAENVAPCGSRSTVSREYVSSIGATSTVPPSSVAFAAVASA